MSRENKRLEKLVRHPDREQWKFDRKMSRRKLIIGGLAIAATYVLADQGLAELNWGDKPNKVAVLPEYRDTESDGLWLIGPGLGVQSSEGIASTLKSSLEPTAPIAFMQVADEGLSIDALAYHTDRLCREREVNKLYLMGHSMGALTVAQVVSRLNLDVAMFICDGSPYDISDVKDETLTVFVKFIVEHYPPGYLSKLIGEVINSTYRDPNPDLSYLDQLRDAYRVSGSGVAPLVWADSIELLGNMDTSVYRRVTTESTKAAYMRPKNADDDKVVKVIQANGRYNNDFDGSMSTLEMDTTFHASPTDFPGQYNQTLSAYLEELRLKGLKPRLHRSTK